MTVLTNRTITFPHDPIKYEVLSWDHMTDLIFLVAEKIAADNLKFDRIVSLAKGGWPMARTLADFLEISEASSIGARSYSGIGEHTSVPEVYQGMHDISGEDILLFDDLSDTGKTLEFINNYLLKRGAKSVTTATVYYKPHSVFKPDYYGKVTSSWVIFPYEILEASRLLTSKWQKQDMPEKEISTRLDSIGCQKSWRQFLDMP